MTPEIDKWYYTSYGYETVLGRCVGIGKDSVILEFRWGDPFRTSHKITGELTEGQDPRWITKIRNLL